MQSLASSGFTDVFPRRKYLKTVGETASFLWVKVLGSGVGFAVKSASCCCIVTADSRDRFTVCFTQAVMQVYL